MSHTQSQYHFHAMQCKCNSRILPGFSLLCNWVPCLHPVSIANKHIYKSTDCREQLVNKHSFCNIFVMEKWIVAGRWKYRYEGQMNDANLWHNCRSICANFFPENNYRLCSSCESLQFVHSLIYAQFKF